MAVLEIFHFGHGSFIDEPAGYDRLSSWRHDVMQMRWYLVEVNGFLFQQHHCVLFLVAVPTPSQHRFPTFSPNSPIIWHSNPIAPAYSHASNMGVTYTRSNFFEKIKEKEKDTQIYFSYVFYNGKKNGNGIFSMKKTTKYFILFFSYTLGV